MTLEEKKKELENSGNAMWALSDIWHEVDKIYDDFESRTCNSCKHHIVSADETIMWCNLENGYLEDCRVDKTFGCNKYEARGKR